MRLFMFSQFFVVYYNMLFVLDACKRYLLKTVYMYFVKAYVIELRDYLEPSSIFQAKANRVIVAFFEGSRL